MPTSFAKLLFLRDPRQRCEFQYVPKVPDGNGSTSEKGSLVLEGRLLIVSALALALQLVLPVDDNLKEGGINTGARRYWKRSKIHTFLPSEMSIRTPVARSLFSLQCLP